ncbi:biotin--[acetyl-CoA-carboxylase] ligase [Planctomicrobium sp. SH668]|uniref:biotin--[acetyl-CoA-carboxylase] ligase n=1 Tax=Planctomicrobium sp. SH668 TaxID=3448126 RepID=UPI003F5BE5F9
MISIERLEKSPFLKRVIWLEETGSTNTFARESAAEIVETPTLVGAESQLAGRGRNQHQWVSRSGALTFSLVIRPGESGIRLSQWPILSITAGLAVCKTLEKFAPTKQVQLKWPNDVYLNGRKVCGILNESIPEYPDKLVVGVGINVNNSMLDGPEELRQSATALIDHADAAIHRTDVLLEFLEVFHEELTALSENEQLIIQHCRERCFLTGKMLTLQDVQSQVTGMCQGIDDDGALRLMTGSGPMNFISGQIIHFD